MSTDLDNEDAFYRKKLLLSLIIPGILVFLMWIVKLSEILFETDLTGLGILPLSVKGLPGIFLSPLIHGDIKHLFSNSIPLFFLGVCVFYFYSEVALRVFFWSWFISGFLVWIAGREVWHVGSSGIIYGLATFLFFSGIIRKYFRLIALSLLIVFLYGSMVWGMVPNLYQNVSWESHMLGGFAGIALAIWYRKEGPQRPVYEWMEEEEDEVRDER
jgi:membrane associated rhomboid family serine protease